MSMAGLFITGTDTGVGKTRVAAAIARCLRQAGLRVGALKPVATGATRDSCGWRCEDAQELIDAIGGGVPLNAVAPILFEAPLAPPVAARLAGRSLEHEAVRAAVQRAFDWWASRADFLLVEGVGGVLCPLAEGTTVADLAAEIDFPLLIVARRCLGTLNHTLLTVEAARSRGLRLAGIILNAAECPPDTLVSATNSDELCRRLAGVPLLAEIDHLEDPGSLASELSRIDWPARCARSRMPIDGPIMPNINPVEVQNSPD